MNLKESYNNLSADKKVRAKQFIILLIFVIVALTAVSIAVSDKEEEIIQDNQNNVVTTPMTDSEIFEDDVIDTMNQETTDLKDEIEGLQGKIEELENLVEVVLLKASDPAVGTSENNNGLLDDVPPADYSDLYPQPVPTSTNVETYSEIDVENTQLQPQWIGGIVNEEYAAIDLTLEEVTELEKKREAILTPGFMKGFLLTGMDAATIEGAADQPEPMLIRVQAPAVLPNDVRANLEGCFVVAEGYGNLATHRVDAKLVSLSCIDFEGKSVIFEQIKGYVQDGDGKRGIKGQPIHRAGALIARTMLAGMFEGIGGALNSSTQVTNLSTQLTTSNSGGSNLTKAAIGGGFTAAAEDIRALFLQLAKQSSPVIEVGAAKQLSVVITSLVILKIQEF